MSWEDILKQKFDFNKLKFYSQVGQQKPYGWRGLYQFSKGGYFSIVMGEGTWSKPDTYLKDPMAYEGYEVLLRHPVLDESYDLQFLGVDPDLIDNYDKISSYSDPIIFKNLTKEEVSEIARLVEETPHSVIEERKLDDYSSYKAEGATTVEDYDSLIEHIKRDNMGLDEEGKKYLIDKFTRMKKDLQEGKKWFGKMY